MFVSQGVGRGETELIEKPDHSVRHKYLKTAYELKGRTVAPEAPPMTIINHAIFYQSEFQQTLREAEAKMKAVIQNAEPTQKIVE